jgi:hypothetical protein
MADCLGGLHTIARDCSADGMGGAGYFWVHHAPSTPAPPRGWLRFSQEHPNRALPSSSFPCFRHATGETSFSTNTGESTSACPGHVAWSYRRHTHTLLPDSPWLSPAAAVSDNREAVKSIVEPLPRWRQLVSYSKAASRADSVVEQCDEMMR